MFNARSVSTVISWCYWMSESFQQEEVKRKIIRQSGKELTDTVEVFDKV